MTPRQCEAAKEKNKYKEKGSETVSHNLQSGLLCRRENRRWASSPVIFYSICWTRFKTNKVSAREAGQEFNENCPP